MRQFWKRGDQELARLEKQLRAHRSEAPNYFVRELRREIAGRRVTFTPRLRYALLAAVVVAMVAAAASAGLPSLPTPLLNNTVSPSGPAPPPPPGGDQYKGKCGKPPGPKNKCKVEVDPDNPSVNAPHTGTTTLTFILTIKDNLTPTDTCTVNWTAAGSGTNPATPLIDFFPIAGQVVFTPTMTTQTVQITIVGHTSPPYPKQKQFTVTWTADQGTCVMDGDDLQDTVKINYTH
jgi:hypothetical protein